MTAEKHWMRCGLTRAASWGTGMVGGTPRSFPWWPYPKGNGGKGSEIRWAVRGPQGLLGGLNTLWVNDAFHIFGEYLKGNSLSSHIQKGKRGADNWDV